MSARGSTLQSSEDLCNVGVWNEMDQRGRRRKGKEPAVDLSDDSEEGFHVGGDEESMYSDDNGNEMSGDEDVNLLENGNEISRDEEVGLLAEDENEEVEIIGDSEFKLKVIAQSEDDAYVMYKRYAFRKGFGVRKSHRVCMHGTTIARIREIVCSNQGLKHVYKENVGLKGRKTHVRTGCGAGVKFARLANGTYELIKFNDSHNHELVPLASSHQIRCHRKIPAPAAATINGLRNARIGPADSYRVIAEASGGYGAVGFTEKDCANYIYATRETQFGPGDCQAMLDHFSMRQSQDPLYYSTYQTDYMSRMTNVFWRDGAAAHNYNHFGDVVVFDTTFKTNRYGLVCAPFVGVNNHLKNIYFGCAFLQFENTESFTWLFKKFLESMGGVAPKTIFTDQDQAMSNAIAIVFPSTTQHRLCIWHIAKNANQHLESSYRDKTFRALFQRLLFGVETPQQFEELWSEMMTDYNFSERARTWLARLYRKKEQWCRAYGRETFTANINSTQRSESANHAFKNMATSTMPLAQFLFDFEGHCEKLREDERKDNFKCFTGRPNILIPDIPLMNHAASIYTLAVFQKFQTEVLKVYAEVVASSTEIEGGHLYKVRGVDRRKVHDVVVGSDATFVTCSCNMWERAGWFCGHIVKVVYCLQWDKIPEEYILRRWTKDLRYSESLSVPPASSRLDRRERSMVSNYDKLVRRSCQVMNLCAESDETTNKAEESLQSLHDFCKQFRAKMNIGDLHEVDERVHGMDEVVRDPTRRRAKIKRKTSQKSYGKRGKGQGKGEGSRVHEAAREECDDVEPCYAFNDYDRQQPRQINDPWSTNTSNVVAGPSNRILSQSGSSRNSISFMEMLSQSSRDNIFMQ